MTELFYNISELNKLIKYRFFVLKSRVSLKGTVVKCVNTKLFLSLELKISVNVVCKRICHQQVNCIIFKMGTIEVKELCEHVWYTLLKDKEHIVSVYGDKLKYFIAGSFATHVDTGQYSFNDIDVFVMGFDVETNHLVDTTKCYDIESSYKRCTQLSNI